MTRPLRDHVGDKQVSSVHQKAAESQQLATDLARFQANGGTIEVLGMTKFEPLTRKATRKKGKPDPTFLKRTQPIETVSLEEADEEVA